MTTTLTETAWPRIVFEEERGLERKVWLVETPPRTVLTHIGGYWESGDYLLPLPWTYYTISIEDKPFRDWRHDVSAPKTSRVCSIFGRPEPLSDDAADELFFLPLPNFYENTMTFCFNNGPITATDVQAQLNEAIGNFWGARGSYVREYAPKFRHIWERFTELADAQKGEIYKYADMGKLYTYWESLSPEEALSFPWGLASVGTIEELLGSRDFGSNGFG